MAGSNGFQYIERPYFYNRRPLRLSINENVGYSGVFYSQPALAALTDKRLFTDATSHPVATPIKLYVNKVAGVSIAIEPSIDASGYTSGCVDYVDYIDDIRDVLDDVFSLHATDSDHDATAFKIAHIKNNRSVYGNLDTTSASGTLDTEYVHDIPASTTPSGSELGTSGIQDIDIDEVSYQPFARPSKTESVVVRTETLPTGPIWPRVISPGGDIPTFGPRDKEVFGPLGLNVAGSGNKLLVTGDRLLQDTNLKVISEGSGSSVVATGSFSQHVDGARYPAGDEMCRYIIASGGSPVITASGRQSLYDPPVVSTEGVYLIAVSEDTATSGNQIQHWPVDWASTSGVDIDNTGIHDGLHVVEKLIYDLRQVAGNRLVTCHSTQNGDLVFGHIVGSETNSLGRGISDSDMAFIFDGNVYTHAGKLSKPVTVVGTTDSREADKFLFAQSHNESWAVTNETMSPVNFQTGSADDQDFVFALRVWHPGTTEVGGNFGIIMAYDLFGVIDKFVVATDPINTPGLTVETIDYEIRRFSENGIDSNGNIVWLEDAGSPEVFFSQFRHYANQWSFGTFYSSFLSANNFKGGVNVNGSFFMQYGLPTGGVRRGRFLVRPSNFQTELFPAQARSQVVTTIGFFPNWKLRLTITTNNQVEINTTVGTTTVEISNTVDFTAFTNDQVVEYGPPIWDEDTGINYLYVQTTGNPTSSHWFCLMNTDFEIFAANPVSGNDAIIFGPIGLLTI